MPMRHASQPLYHRVYRQIAEEIERGGLSPATALPSERWLCDELGVSRATVRRALEELVADGLVETRGRASFVAGEALAEPPNALMSLPSSGARAASTATARVLAREVAAGHDRRGRGVPDRSRSRAARPPAPADARRHADLARPQPGAAAPRPRRRRTSTSRPPRCTTRSSATATRPRTPTTRSRRGPRRAARRSCSGSSPGPPSCSRRRSPCARTAGWWTWGARSTGPTGIDSRRR